MAEKHLKTLSRLTQNHGLGEIHKCIADLAANGLRPERFAADENRPNRQEVTPYLASWCRMIGLSQAQCAEWLVDYCQETLASISRSSLSQIRHSTKSNIKYIYRAAGSFVCYGPHNFFKAACDEAFPFYHEQMLLYEKYLQEKNAVKNYALREVPLEERLAQQLQEALIETGLERGLTRPQIVELLRNKGYKTRTGLEWSLGVLNLELQKLRKQAEKAKSGVG
jgi:hypothetical protein